jgi:hypothetical protein
LTAKRKGPLLVRVFPELGKAGDFLAKKLGDVFTIDTGAGFNPAAAWVLSRKIVLGAALYFHSPAAGNPGQFRKGAAEFGCENRRGTGLFTRFLSGRAVLVMGQPFQGAPLFQRRKPFLRGAVFIVNAHDDPLYRARKGCRQAGKIVSMKNKVRDI